jgi:hypothetical protein
VTSGYQLQCFGKIVLGFAVTDEKITIGARFCLRYGNNVQQTPAKNELASCKWTQNSGKSAGCVAILLLIWQIKRRLKS